MVVGWLSESAVRITSAGNIVKSDRRAAAL
jgi:hypothetical protein